MSIVFFWGNLHVSSLKIRWIQALVNICNSTKIMFLKLPFYYFQNQKILSINDTWTINESESNLLTPMRPLPYNMASRPLYEKTLLLPFYELEWYIHPQLNRTQSHQLFLFGWNIHRNFEDGQQLFCSNLGENSRTPIHLRSNFLGNFSYKCHW